VLQRKDDGRNGMQRAASLMPAECLTASKIMELVDKALEDRNVVVVVVFIGNPS
jgi:hypothetical protein